MASKGQKFKELIKKPRQNPIPTNKIRSNNFLQLMLLKLNMTTNKEMTIATKFKIGLATDKLTRLMEKGMAITVPAKPVMVVLFN